MEGAYELIRQYVFFTSILSGFAFSIAIQLISIKDEKKITSFTIAVFIIAALVMLVSTFVGGTLIVRLTGLETGIPPELVKPLNDVGMMAFVLFFAGLVLFAVGIGSAGWIQSRRVGLASSIAAAIAVVVVFVVFGQIF